MVDLFSWEAEEAVLGFLLNPLIKIDDKRQIIQVIDTEYFTNDKYQLLFTTIKDNRIFDKILLKDRLGESIDIIDIENIDMLVTPTEIQSYIEILLDRLHRRKIYALGKEIQDSIAKGHDAFDTALRAESKIMSLTSRAELDTNQELLQQVLEEKQ